MRQAIITKFHGPTNVKGSRYSARANAGRIILNSDHSVDYQRNHILAAQALAKKLGWKGVWSGGGLPNGGGFVFVTADSDDFIVGPIELGGEL
jgi:hypothetical protein